MGLLTCEMLLCWFAMQYTILTGGVSLMGLLMSEMQSLYWFATDSILPGNRWCFAHGFTHEYDAPVLVCSKQTDGVSLVGLLMSEMPLC